MVQKKKKLVQINTVGNASTGRIMHGIQREAAEQGYETISFVGRRKPYEDLPCEKFGDFFSFWFHVAVNTVFDRQGYASWFTTRRLVRRLREEKPDIIHMHNLHGYYLYLPLLFGYLKKEFKGQLYWTFHDCWPFTGHCAYYSMAQCDKWKKQCEACPNKRRYPVSLFFDASKKNYADKKELFTGLQDLTVMVPSEWMKEQVEHSFMSAYEVKVVPNGIDLSRFSYKPDQSLYLKYKLPEDKKLLLGVANVWDKRKGLQDFLRLSHVLGEEYRIVLVGLSKGQIRRLPKNMIGIERTEDQEELAGMYSLADIFINPSLEESFSLVTVEAFACGTPVIVLDTSAVKELVNERNGIVLTDHEPEDYQRAIEEIAKRDLRREEISRTAERYSEKGMLEQIISVYGEKA